MPKINHEEYGSLKSLDDKWKWIARDEKGELWAYSRKPTKENKFWREGILMGLSNGILQFIQREDDEPYNIQELIEEYEDSKEYKDSLVIEYFLDKRKRK